MTITLLTSFTKMIGERKYHLVFSPPILYCMRSLILLICLASVAVCSQTSMEQLLKSLSENKRYSAQSAISSNDNPLSN